VIWLQCLPSTVKISSLIREYKIICQRQPRVPGKQEDEGVSKKFRIGLLEQELQMVQLSATRCNSIVILWVSIGSFAAITLCVASERLLIVVSVYFVIDSVRKLLDTLSYGTQVVSVDMADFMAIIVNSDKQKLYNFHRKSEKLIKTVKHHFPN
jgi:hypothetical protein